MAGAPRYVRHRGKPEWGIGRVLSVAPDSTVEAFFAHGGRRKIDQTIVKLEAAPTPNDDTRRVLEVAATVKWERSNHNVYVIKLAPEVVGEDKFLGANSGYIPGTKFCVYVGMTGLTPEERFRRHRAGIQANRYVKRYGVDLCPTLYADLNPMPHDLAKEMEPWLARFLRAEGYGVWQN